MSNAARPILAVLSLCALVVGCEGSAPSTPPGAASPPQADGPPPVGAVPKALPKNVKVGNATVSPQ